MSLFFLFYFYGRNFIEKMSNRIHFKVNAEMHNKTAFQFLKDQGVSTTLIRQLKNEERILINGEPLFMNHKVVEGDLIELILHPEKTEGIEAEPIDFEILFEDNDLLIINKPAKLTIHPTFNYTSGTLANGVLYYWQQHHKEYRFRPVNRLDRDTSGIVIIALNAFAQFNLAEQQKSKYFTKIYSAVVHGIIDQNEGEIVEPIGRKSTSIIEREVRPDGQYAHTRFYVESRFAEMTWVKAHILTGRTHQIRVHFSHIGHPLVGDDLYGGQRLLINRQALHAEQVIFYHPRTKEQMIIYAPLPDDLRQLLKIT